MAGLIQSLARRKAAPYAIAALGAALALAFVLATLSLPGPLADRSHDADHFGALGMGLWQQGTLAYHPDSQPIIQRGPVYPALVAALLWVSGGRMPQAVFLAQACLQGLICLAVWALARRLFNARLALWAALICALHPFLIWYTAKIWVENLQTLLFTLIMLAAMLLAQAPSHGRAALLGLLLGLASLTKAVALPFTLLVPLGLLLLRPARVKPSQALAAVLVAWLLVAPWTARNYALTGRFIPVHGLGGFNMVVGDEFARHWLEAPLSYSRLFLEHALPRLDAIKSGIDADQPLWAQQLQLDERAMAQSLATYRQEPLFLARKVLVNSVMFWFLGYTPASTLALAALQLPLLVFFARGAWRALRRQGLRSPPGLLVGMVLCYLALHLPIFCFARLSSVLVPMMVVMACAGFIRPEETEAT